MEKLKKRADNRATLVSAVKAFLRLADKGITKSNLQKFVADWSAGRSPGFRKALEQCIVLAGNTPAKILVALEELSRSNQKPVCVEERIPSRAQIRRTAQTMRLKRAVGAPPPRIDAVVKAMRLNHAP
jgi:hypothetical protein